jgi:beta-glucosidase
MIVSDWNSFGETIVHGAAADDEDAAAKCLVAGSDMDMVSGVFQRGLEKALKDGRVRQDQIDEAVRRVLRLKFQLGLFDDPFRYLDPKRRASTLERADFRQQSRELAAKSMVLLKNEQNVLPLTGKGPIKKIAIVGPYADSRSDKDYLSFWTGAIGVDYDASKVVTAAQGLKPALEALGYQVTVVQLCATGDCGEADFAAAVKATQAADLVIGCVGEHGNDCGESRCVSDLNLSRQQESLLKALHRGGKPVVMVLFNSRPLTFEWARQNLPAILVAWQPGYEAGNAVADVLTGKVNPAGKLPMTFPRSVGQVPLYYNHFNTGRPQEKYPTMWTSGYLDLTSEPAWPFGFGLSYTTFTYSDIRLDKSKIGLEETLVARVTVTNSGSVEGQEVVQLYTRDLTADVTRPLRELKAFEKISLRPGESKEVVLRVDARDLGYYNGDLVFKTDPGKFKVFVGGSSANTKEADFEVGK